MPGADAPVIPAGLRPGLLAGLLERWREAERRWESTNTRDVSTERAVVDAFVAYHEAAGTYADELLLIVDGDGSYVAVSGDAAALLGYPATELVGRSIAELTHPEDVQRLQELWPEFLAQGVQAGAYRLRDRRGEHVELRYRARAHTPIPGYHLSRLRP